MSVTPRPEYPRPQFRRADWINLNGTWQFAFDDADAGLALGWQRTPADVQAGPASPFDRHIVVPFCHQARLSGIGDTGFHDIVWYARTFATPALPPGGRLLLHFGAVDYRATVWVNGEQVAQHEGGHTPFHADVTYELHEEGVDNVVVVRAWDPGQDKTIPRGKQSWREQSSHIFYTRTTGIWQTVWLEPVPPQRIGVLLLTADIGEGQIEAEITVEGFEPGLGASLRLVAIRGDRTIVEARVTPLSDCTVASLSLLGSDEDRHGLALWSPEEPNLYDLRVELLDAAGEVLDAVDSYFGMRQVEVRGDEVYLNGRLYYQRLVLDQGYFPAGILTAPTDDDLRRDVEWVKEFGFNGVRKHQKVEDPRWLYWADTLGLLVWGEMANAYGYSADYVRRITAEWGEVVRRDYNHPCIVTWVPMNESAGGRLVESEPLRVEHLLTLYHLTRSLDVTRPVVSNDGWEHTLSDLCTIHDYGDAATLAQRYATRETAIAAVPPMRPPYHPGFAYRGEPILITEFGGLLSGKTVAGLAYSVVEDDEALLRTYEGMVTALLQSDIVRGFCYTQLTDVEQEVNGLLTADRRPKVDPALVHAFTTRERVSG